MSEAGFRVRLTMPTSAQLNTEIERILRRKEESITRNSDLRYFIVQKYGEAVAPYVPMSNENKRHHLKDAYITKDGRIIWSAVNKGFNYADIQYTTPSITWAQKSDGVPGYYHPKRYVGHKPTDQWTSKVQPNTTVWKRVFIPSIRDAVKGAYRNG